MRESLVYHSMGSAGERVSGRDLIHRSHWTLCARPLRAHPCAGFEVRHFVGSWFAERKEVEQFLMAHCTREIREPRSSVARASSFLPTPVDFGGFVEPFCPLEHAFARRSLHRIPWTGARRNIPAYRVFSQPSAYIGGMRAVGLWSFMGGAGGRRFSGLRSWLRVGSVGAAAALALEPGFGVSHSMVS